MFQFQHMKFNTCENNYVKKRVENMDFRVFIVFGQITTAIGIGQNSIQRISHEHD